MASGAGEFRNGWRAIVACAAGVGVGLTGLPFYTFGIFITPLSDDMGWNRSMIAAGMLCLNAGVIFVGPLIGVLMDRFGVRLVAIPSLIGVAVGFFLLSLSGPTIGSFYMAWLAVAVLGAGTTPLTWTRAISERFDRARGLALGLTLLGTGLASIFGPPLIQELIATGGWRSGYRGMAWFVLFVAVPLAVFGLWHRREPVAARTRGAGVGAGMTWPEAVKTKRFWLIAGGIFLVIVGQASSTVHFVPLLRDRGIDAGTAAGVAGLFGASVIIGRVVVGYLLDRFHGPKIARIFLSLPALALLLLIWRSDLATARVAAVLLGIAAGAEVDLLAYFVSRYFGLRSYGAIYGTALSAFGLGAGLGPTLAGHAYDVAGNYDGALVAGVCVFLAGVACLGFLGGYPAFTAGCEGAGADTGPPASRSASKVTEAGPG